MSSLAHTAAPLFTAGRNVPYALDFFLEVGGLSRARPGRLGFDGQRIEGGLTLWAGPFALTIEVHAFALAGLCASRALGKPVTSTFQGILRKARQRTPRPYTPSYAAA